MHGRAEDEDVAVGFDRVVAGDIELVRVVLAKGTHEAAMKPVGAEVLAQKEQRPDPERMGSTDLE
jgi:hypothetical protein